MTKTQHQKLEVPFHRLTEEEIRQWYQDKLLTTAGYLLAIKRVTRPPGVEFIIPNVIKFCKEWGISKSAFYRAVDELKQKGYTNWEATHGIVIRESRKILSFPSEKKCPTSGTVSHERDSQSHERDSQSHERENRSRKHPQRKASSALQTIQTYSDFIQTLSEGERENFETFIREEWRRLKGDEIVSLDRFLAKPEDQQSWHERFLKSPVGKEAKKRAIASSHDWRNDPCFIEWIHEAFNRGYEWVHEDEAEREQRKTFYDWAFAVNAFEGVCL